MYVKLFNSMYDGSLPAAGWKALVTFQQLLVLADRFGVVDLMPEAISRRTTIPLDIIVEGLAALEQPDPRSRTPEEDGRRIICIDPERGWGWEIVNYKKYRTLQDAEQRRARQAEKQARYRQRKRDAALPSVTPCLPDVYPCSPQAEAEAEVDTTTTSSPAPRAKAGRKAKATVRATPSPADAPSRAAKASPRPERAGLGQDWLAPIAEAYTARRGPGTFNAVAGRWAKAFRPLADTVSMRDCALAVWWALRPKNPDLPYLTPEKLAGDLWANHPWVCGEPDAPPSRWPNGALCIKAGPPTGWEPYRVHPSHGELAIYRHPETGEPVLVGFDLDQPRILRPATPELIAYVTQPAPQQVAA